MQLFETDPKTLFFILFQVNSQHKIKIKITPKSLFKKRYSSYFIHIDAIYFILVTVTCIISIGKSVRFQYFAVLLKTIPYSATMANQIIKMSK